jgi:hypothetical protein
MFKRVFLLTFFAAIILSLHAQKVTIKLSKETLDINNDAYYVDSVIDARNQGECIGFTLKGMDFRQTAAYFEQPFCKELQDLFSRSLPESKNSIPLILRMNKFLLSSYYLAEKYYSIVEVNISFISNENGKYYELYRGMASVESGSLYNIGPGPAIIAGTLNKCFNDFVRSSNGSNFSGVEIEQNTLADNPLYNHKYKIEQVTEPERGIYHNYSDFLNYKVDTLKPINVEYIPESEKAPAMANVVLAQDNTWVGNIWGFSDGKTSYINVKGNYYPLYRQDSAFRFQVLRTGTKLEDLSPYIAGALFVGIVSGALLGFAVVPIIPDPVKDAIMECQIELNSGLIMPVNLVKYKEMNSRTILYMSKYQKEENEMEIYLDGDFLCKLNRNNYYLLTIPPDKQQVELCLKSKTLETCETYKPVPYDAGVFICEVKNNQPPTKAEAKAEIRKGILDKIFSGEIEMKCP